MVALATTKGVTTSEIVTSALVAYLAEPTRVEPTSEIPDTLPLFEPAEPNETTSPFLLPDPIQNRAVGKESATDRDAAILKLHSERLSNVAIGREVGCNEASVRRALKRLGVAPRIPRIPVAIWLI